MDFYGLAERIMGMDESVWERHANPWSVYTRIPILPLLALAVWSRVWLGWWALGPVLVLLLWSWLNPRIFPPSKSTENWASKGVLGERLWLNRKAVPVPAAHGRAVRQLALLAGWGTLLLGWGLVALHPWLALLGLVVALLGKLWFLDRMVWLYEDSRGLPECADRAESPERARKPGPD